MIQIVRLYRVMLIVGLLVTSGCGGGDGDDPPVGPPAPGGAGSTTIRVSVGSEADDSSFNPSISSDGRFIAFASDATNLVGADSNGVRDIFVRDTTNNTTVLVSVDSSGIQTDESSFTPSISSDGRFIAFASDATNLVGADSNGVRDIFVRDTTNNTTVLVSVDSSGIQTDESSFTPSISSDGRFIAFASDATNLVGADSNGIRDIFVRDTTNNTTVLVSVDSSGIQTDESSFTPSISSDGRFIAFASDATNLVGADSNGIRDIFVRDTTNNTTVLVSVDSSGIQTDESSFTPSISSDGRFIAFASDATNLVGADSNGVRDIFVRDTTNNTTVLVSVDSSGIQTDESSFTPSISLDGRFIAFASDATNLVGADSNGVRDIFVRDTTNNTTVLISVDSSGIQTDESSFTPSISSDGNHIAFESDATNLVTGDLNGVKDIFVRSP